MSNYIETTRFERLPAILTRVSVTRSTLYRWVAASKFPAPIRLGENTVAWDSRAVDRWIADRITESRSAESLRTLPERMGKAGVGGAK